MSILLHGDCLEQLQSVDDNSVDFIFCDLPYGQTSCAWDTIIAWDPFWKEILRVKKLHTQSSRQKMFAIFWQKIGCHQFLKISRLMWLRK